MHYRQQYRQTPPTPTPPSSICSSTTSSFSGSLSYPNSPFSEWEDEKRKQLVHLQTLLSQKEHENTQLKEALTDWKARARKYYDAQEKLEEQLRSMTAEKEALTKAYAKKCNDDADTIMALSEQIDALKRNPESSDTTDPCVTAEETYKKAASQVMYGRKKANNLILGINDMVQAIEEELSYLQTDRETDDTRDTTKEHKDTPDETEPAIPENVQHHMDAPPVTAAPDEATVPEQQHQDTSTEQKQDISNEQKQDISNEQKQDISTEQQQDTSIPEPARTFRPRSQTMDTIVKKASMFLRSSNGNKKNDSKKARPQPTALPIRDLAQTKLATTEKVGTRRQMFRRMSSQALSSYYQSTPLFIKSPSSKASTQKEVPMTLRQAIAAAEHARKQNNTSSLVTSIDGHDDEIIPSVPKRSTLLLHYQKQQQQQQQLQNRTDGPQRERRRSALIATCSSPLAGGTCPAPSTATATNKSAEQWRLSGRGQ